MTRKVPSIRYEFRLLLLLSLTNGVVALERLSASFLSPFLVADFGLTNTQLGLLAAALSGAVAVSATLFGSFADRDGRKKSILLIATIGFSLIAGLPALVTGFIGLLFVRMLLGIAEGPVVPLSQSMMAQVSDPRRRGLNMGLLQMAGAYLIGGMAGPVLATYIATDHGWRMAFTASVIPGLVMALALWLFVKPDDRGKVAVMPDQPKPPHAPMLSLLKIRNIRLCVIIAGLFAAWATVQNVFLPVYLVSERGMSPTTMGWVIAAGGLAGLLGGFGVPALSDWVGRKPVMVVCGALMLFAPAAILWLPANPVAMSLAVLIGWLVMGMAPMYIGVIPTESVPPHLTASAIGLATAAGEVFGGVLAPFGAGALADSQGLSAPFLLCLGLAAACAMATLFLQESAPRLVDRDRV
ncbi:MFS transporter [Altererythrobacter xixiisoli]|uniref:MFS transporter n=1 Tax=Croceibacterium xixiisoli TaxID=1476466 RepID=A0A6I4TYX4_9SPHN|nr:MFS transporter [Croceibacterium xixiisoli]